MSSLKDISLKLDKIKKQKEKINDLLMVIKIQHIFMDFGAFICSGFASILCELIY